MATVWSEEIRTVPVGDVLVGDARRDIEHDDAALAVDVVAVAETAKLLLTRRVPHVELDLAVVLQVSSASATAHAQWAARATYGGEAERVNLNAQRGHVLLLELASQVALDEGGLEHHHVNIQDEPISVHSATPQSPQARTLSRSSSQLTLPVPPSPTRTSLKVGTWDASAMVGGCVLIDARRKLRPKGSPRSALRNTKRGSF
jgi:hypothetical protein